MRRSRSTKRTPLRKSSRWNKAKRSIPNAISNNLKVLNAQVNQTGALICAGAQLNILQMSQITSGTSSITRERNNIFIKGFTYDFYVRAAAICTMPTTMRIACLVQAGSVLTPSSTDLFSSWNNLEDNVLPLSQVNTGWANIMAPINKAKYSVIWSKTIQLGPGQFNAATTVSSHLPAQKFCKGYIKYNKKVMFDTDASTSLTGNNVYFMWWFDDALRDGGIAATTQHNVMGQFRTLFTDT